MSRERKYDYTSIRSAAIGVIGEVSRKHMSHSDMLAMRQARVFEAPEWKRLTAYHQAEILGMFSGAVEAWHATQAIVWTHVHNGQRIVAPLPTGTDYSAIDTDQSKHAWSADLSRLF